MSKGRTQGWTSIWRRMSPTERREAALEYLREAENSPKGREGAIKFLSQECRTSPNAVAHWDLDRRADRLARSVHLRAVHFASLVAAFHVRRKAPMLTRFLDEAGIPHINGIVDPRTMQDACAKDALLHAVLSLRSGFPAREVALYLDALEAQEAPAFAHLAAARAEAAGMPDPTPADVEVPTVASEDETAKAPSSREVRREKDELDDPLYSDLEALTALDDVLKEASVAAAANIVGAFDFQTLRAAADEIVRLNPKRHRSYYHLGFLDFLEGHDPSARFPRASERQRGWYLCGAVHALARQGDRSNIVALFDRHPSEGRRILGARHEATTEGALPIVDALLAEDRRADALGALVPTAVARAGMPLMECLLAEALGCLRGLRPEEAMPILKLLADGIEARLRLRRDVDPAFVEAVHVRRALALRLQGAFDAAKEAYEALLDSPRSRTVADGTVGLGLVACRVRSLSDVRLPARSADLEATARRLAAGRDQLERVDASEDIARLQADLCLGTLALAEGRTKDAHTSLARAVTASASREELDEGHGALDRARLYLGLAQAEALVPERMEEAVEHVVAGARTSPEEAHAYLLERVLVAVSTARPRVAAEATHALYGVLGDGLLDAALGAGMLPKHEALREVLATRAEASKRRHRDRGTDAENLLRECIEAEDIARAERALEVLEDLSDDASGRARLLAILEDRTRYDPAWRPAEALYTRVRLLEAEGRYADAAVLLCGAGHELLSADPERGLFAADDLLERIGSYGVDVPDPSLVTRVQALRASAPPAPTIRSPKGRVYFVGGNEVQARYEKWLTAEARKRWPKVSIEFDFSGWAKNWGRNLPAIEGRVRNADAVVVMRFIRTLLGRTLRGLCGENGLPWIPCTGHGRQSLLAAIERAVQLLDRPSPPERKGS